jgi:hypothetical protein
MVVVKALVKVFWLPIVAALLFWVMTEAQPQALPPYKPTEIQSLRLQVKQRDALLAQKDWQVAQEHYQAAVAILNAEGEAIRKENHWPDTVKFDANTIEFSEPAPVSTRPPPPMVNPPAKGSAQ